MKASKTVKASKITKTAKRGRPAKKPKKNGWGGPRANAGGARPGAGRPRRLRRIKDYRALGDCPADELEAMRWMFRANGVRARQVMLDEIMSDEKRGSELRAISKVMHQLLPRNRLRKAEKLIKGEADASAAAKPSPTVEPAPTPAPEEGAST